MNSLTVYVNAKDLSKDVFECIMKKICCEYSIHNIDGEEYYKFIYKRTNDLAPNNGIFAKLDFSGIVMEDVELVANQLTETVDKMKLPDFFGTKKPI